MSLSGSGSVADDILGYEAYFTNTLGAATVTLSLATNVIATSLIAYKAWCVYLRLIATYKLLIDTFSGSIGIFFAHIWLADMRHCACSKYSHFL